MTTTRAEHVAAGPRAAVVGAGLAGLSAAFRLRQRGWRVTLYEASGAPGGRVRTLRRDGFVIDTGACALTDAYHAYRALAAELGLAQEFSPCSQHIGIFRDNKIELLQLNRALRSLFSTRLLSVASKLKLMRLGWDVACAKLRGRLDYSDMSRAAPLDTESAQTYALRVLNSEIDAYLCDPITRAMLIADSSKISKVELFSGIANIFGSRISALNGGQGTFADALSDRVTPEFHCTVTSVVEQGEGVLVGMRRGNGLDASEVFDACIVTCPLPTAVEICPGERARLAPLQAVLRYTQCITVAVATHVAARCPAFLVHLPACEDPHIALLFLNHNMAPDRAPPGRGLIDCHWETGAAERFMPATDGEIIEQTLVTVFRLFPELRGQVRFSHVARWPAALPMTTVGTYQAIARFNARLKAGSRLQFAGDYMSAAGQNTAVELGQRAAARLAASFGRQNQGLRSKTGQQGRSA